MEQASNEIIKYFCQALPRQHNLLAWDVSLHRSGEVFRHPEGMMYQIMTFENNDFLPLVHVMVIGVN